MGYGGRCGPTGPPAITHLGVTDPLVAVMDGSAPSSIAKPQEPGLIMARMNEAPGMAGRAAGSDARDAASSEARYRAIFDTEPECVKLLAADGSLLEINAAGLRMLEADSFHQVEGQNVARLVVQEHRDAFRSLTARVFRGESGTLEFQMVGLKGSRRWMETHAGPLTGADGAITAMLGITRDITHRRQAEAALRESEAKFRTICEAAPVGVFLVRPDGHVTYRNPADLRLIGLAWADAMGLNWIAAVHPAERAQVRAEWQASHASGRPYAGTGRYQRPDGAIVWWDVTTTPVYDSETLLGYVGLALDITGRMRAEEEVRRREARYLRQRNALITLTGSTSLPGDDLATALATINEWAAKTLDVARVSVWRYNEEHTAIQCLDGYELETHRHSSGMELLRARFPAYFDALRDAEVIAANDARSDPRTLEFTESYLRPLGITAVMDAAIHLGGAAAGVISHEHIGPPRVWTDDEKAFAVAMANMVSLAMERWERQRAEAHLRDAQNRLRLAVSLGKVGLWDWDVRANRVNYSSEWKQQVGHSDDEIADNLDEWQSRVHPDDLGRAFAVMKTCLDGPEAPFEVEFRFRHKNGSYRNILSRGSTLFDEAGLPIRMVGANVDLTEWTELQAHFLQSQKMESVGQLAGGIAHDFNNLLTVINGTADLVLSEMEAEDPLRADLLQIRNAGDRAASLTRQLLAFSRKQILTPDILDLNLVAGDMQGMLQRLIGVQIDLVINLARSLGAVQADSGQIQQVIMNLAVNARDAMPDGGTLTIETRNVTLDTVDGLEELSPKSGPYAMLAVTDTGVGMDAVTRGRIFEPFFTTKGPSQGTGLGLSTVYGIIRQSGGHIRVDSEPGRGTTFRIYLPQVDAAEHAERSARRVAVSGSRETVLIVEDEPAVRHLATRFLQASGYHVVTASSGTEALVLLEGLDRPVHLMLTDVVMPGMTGRDLAVRLAAGRPEMKVLYTSGFTDDTVLRQGVIDSAAHFVAKPYTMEELSRKVREAIDSASGA